MRLAAPPYRGEGPRALWHVSEDPAIRHFAPHRAPTALTDEPLVWAVDTRHLPLYWFPRDCPRCTFWASDRTSDPDVARLLAGRRDLRRHVVERGWLERIARTRVFLYRMPVASFSESVDTAGYWLSRVAVDPLERVTAEDLVGWHAAAGIQLDAMPNLWPLWDEVAASTLEFSGIRLRHAQPRAAA